jgi:hypothetical protein
VRLVREDELAAADREDELVPAGASAGVDVSIAAI